MKWIENGISFEGTVAEYKELHDGMIPAPVRTRKGKSITLRLADGTEKMFSTLKEAAEYITNSTGKFVSASHLGKQVNGASVSIENFAGGKEVPLFHADPELQANAAEPDLPATASGVDAVPGSAPAQDELPANDPAEPAPASATV
ncbi:MAG: hypothetical protein IJT68_06385 [Lentisphaeria bacterium]|nr:hypothetical protein [Lentisphaeria bacterium]